MIVEEMNGQCGRLTQENGHSRSHQTSPSWRRKKVGKERVWSCRFPCVRLIRENSTSFIKTSTNSTIQQIDNKIQQIWEIKYEKTWRFIGQKTVIRVVNDSARDSSENGACHVLRGAIVSIQQTIDGPETSSQSFSNKKSHQ